MVPASLIGRRQIRDGNKSANVLTLKELLNLTGFSALIFSQLERFV